MVGMLIQKIDDEVQLRMFYEDDAEEFFNLIMESKSYLKKWLGWVDHTKTVEDTTQFIKSGHTELIENGGYPTSFAIIYKGKIAGTIGFNEIDKTNKKGFIGYWLGEKFQGKGIMSRAFKSVVDYGFKELKLNRIQVNVAVDNHKSRAIPERFGFKKEGMIRQAEWLYDHYVDHIIYGLLAREWKSF